MESSAGWINLFREMRDELLRKEIFEVSTAAEFSDLAIRIFHFQYTNNPVYRKWCDALGADPMSVDSLSSIPFMPVAFFRDHMILSGKRKPQAMFSSSGTTGMKSSSHFVTDISVYNESLTKAFTMFYGDPSSSVILALLPSYLERKDSSLVYMVDRLISMSPHNAGGFYLDNYEKMLSDIEQYRKDYSNIIVIGVTFALLDLAEKFSPDLNGITVMETGGMKGRRKELTREELHLILTQRFNTLVIHSEYGMTECLSQSYSAGSGIFRSPPWMKVMIRDMYDPFSYVASGTTGGINIIDLANIYSCSFIETSDLGISKPDGSFEVTGRFDNSDIRGCNLLVQ